MMKRLPPPEKTDPFAAISQPAGPEIKRKRGRPPNPKGKLKLQPKRGFDRKIPANQHQPSPEMRKTISNMASYGLDIMMISKLAGITPSAIHTHYAYEMATAAAQKDLMVLQGAFLKAVGGPDQKWEKADAQMQRWWIERRQGWQAPPQRIISERMDLSKLSDRQLDELERIMEAAALDAGRDQTGEGE